MQNHTGKGLVLNIIPIEFNADEIEIGILDPMSKEEYKQLREEYWYTHVFRFDRRINKILNIALDTQKPKGLLQKVALQENLLLMSRALQRKIFVWLSNNNYKFLHVEKKLVFLGRQKLLSDALKDLNINPISNLEILLKNVIDCRMFQTQQGKFLGLVIDLSAKYVLDIPMADLIKKGFNPIGKYVCSKNSEQSAFLDNDTRNLGRVSKIKGNILFLEDHIGIEQVNTTDVFLEPRIENFQTVLSLYYKNQASNILNILNTKKTYFHNGLGMLEHLKTLVASLQKHLTQLNNIDVKIGDLLASPNHLFPNLIETQRPMLLFGPQGNSVASIPDEGIKRYGPYMYLQHNPTEPLVVILCEPQYRGQIEQFIQMLKLGFPNEHLKNNNNPYMGGLIGKYRLSNLRLVYEEISGQTADAYKNATLRVLNKCTTTPDIAIVQIKESFSNLHGNNNPYLVSKATFMSMGVPTQSIRIEKIQNINLNLAYLLNSISVAIYAKLNGVPWVISTPPPTSHELVVGLGVTEISDGRLSKKTRYIGFTSIFQGDGRYLVWGTTKEVEYENYPNALLESLKQTIEFVQQQNTWQEGDRIRLICHVYKPLKNCEIDAIKELVGNLINQKYYVEFAFLDISSQHPYHIFDSENQQGVVYRDSQQRKGIGVPQRGIALKIDERKGLIQLTGPSDVKTYTHGLPKPLLVDLHPDSDFQDMAYLLRQIYHFSYMSWRSYIPSSEPVTMIYSRLVAQKLGQFRQVDGWDSKTMPVNLRSKRWFL